MPGKTRKLAALSPQKTRQSPAKYVRLTEHDDDSEKREATANKIALGHQRNKSIIDNSYPSPRKTSSSMTAGTPAKNGASHTVGTSSPIMKMPILANFEEWMKMATDNKINAGNSWNFALIDYFHEMSLLKEGNSINFQKASVTLDGCVKIYTNRVDSVATETGKLLSGLSTKKESANEEDNNDDDGSLDEEEREIRKSKKKSKTSSGSTLVKDFSAIQIKKLDVEFSVDPLFKKTSAEFDEGGAKGLLLNHLCVDRAGRIIFDASDASNESMTPEVNSQATEDIASVDIEALGQKFFPELFDGSDCFEDLHVCPFLRNFQSDSTVIDIPLITDMTGNLNEAEDASQDHKLYGDVDDAGNDPESGLQGIVDVFDNNENAEFGEVNEIHIPFNDNTMDNSFSGPQAIHGAGKGVLVGSENYLQMGGASEHLFAQFDHLLRKNWAGPANWKITRLNNALSSMPIVKKPRKEKEVMVIDFLSPEGEVDEDIIFASGGANINLPKTQWNSKTRNLLPEDKHFNSESLLRLFLKPKARIGNRKTFRKSEGDDDQDAEGRFVEMDENFWAKQNAEAKKEANQNSYDSNFFDSPQDNGDDFDDNFEDAKQDFAAEPLSDFGSQLQEFSKNRKTEYVNYAKAAKKVDVRVLKENIWEKLDLPSLEDKDTKSQTLGGERKFTEVVQSLSDVYAEKAMSEISTSFCFICLLHLANEKGLEIVGDGAMQDLTVRRDESVVAIEAV